VTLNRHRADGAADEAARSHRCCVCVTRPGPVALFRPSFREAYARDVERW
jgi:hypothetical protein